jgi:hypothetical protein
VTSSSCQHQHTSSSASPETKRTQTDRSQNWDKKTVSAYQRPLKSCCTHTQHWPLCVSTSLLIDVTTTHPTFEKLANKKFL